MIQNLIFGNFLQKYYFIFGHTTLWYSSTRFRGHYQIFLIFRFSSRNSQSQQKLAKNFTHFTIQFCSENLTHFMNLNSLDIEKNMLSQHSQKPFSLYKFSSHHFSVWCQKKHLHCFIFWLAKTAFLKHFESKCLYIPVHLRKKIFVPET